MKKQPAQTLRLDKEQIKDQASCPFSFHFGVAGFDGGGLLFW
jgi:hypothetical protein